MFHIFANDASEMSSQLPLTPRENSYVCADSRTRDSIIRSAKKKENHILVNAMNWNLDVGK